MAGLLDFGSNPYAGLLSEEDLASARRQATTDALLKLSSGLFQAGAPSRTPQSLGAALVGGLQGVGAGYQNTLQQAAQQKLMQQKIQDAVNAKKRQAEIQGLISGAYQPAQAANVPMVDGERAAGPVRPEIPAGFNLQAIAPQLLALGPEGQKAFGDIVAAQKAMQGETLTVAPGSTVVRVGADGQPEVLATGTPKVVKPELAASFAEAVDVLGLPRKNASEYTESERLAINKKLNELSQSKRQIIMNEGQKGFENTTSLKKQFASEPIYKAYEDMKVSYGQVSSAIKAGTPIGDTAAATKIMKLLDPGSVVRETELGMAMAATGKMDLLRNYFENYMKGTKLTDTQRTEFQSLANELFNAAAIAYNEKRGEYKDLGASFNLNTDLALGKPAKVQGAIKRIGWEE